MTHRRMPCRPTLLSLALLLAAGTARAGTPAPVFASEIAVVNVHATVTRGDAPVPDGLSAADFRVIEDGRPQEVAYFAHEEVPVTYTLLVDVSGSMRKRARLVFEALETFVESMRPGDRAGIVLFGTTAKVLQQETGDREALLAATDRIPEDFDDGTALYEVLYGHFGEASPRACRAEGAPRRCALVVFSDGKDETSRRSFRADVIDSARRTELAVYPVAMTRHDAFLERLARETGGRVSYVDHGGELADAYRAIAAELASQYTIGYVPEAAPRPGAWRPVKVTVARKGVTVRHRPGYFTVALGD
jgi:Ca-activated chloride channel family protein